jgi:hypothetical protein
MPWYTVKYNHKNFMQFFAFSMVGLAMLGSYVAPPLLKYFGFLGPSDTFSTGVNATLTLVFVDMARKIFRITPDDRFQKHE